MPTTTVISSKIQPGDVIFPPCFGPKQEIWLAIATEILDRSDNSYINRRMTDYQFYSAVHYVSSHGYVGCTFLRNDELWRILEKS